LKFEYFEKPLLKSIREMDEAHQTIALDMGLPRFKTWVERTPKNNLNGGGAEYVGGNRWHKSFDLKGSRYLYFFDYYSPKEGTCRLERIELGEIPAVDPLELRIEMALRD